MVSLTGTPRIQETQMSLQKQYEEGFPKVLKKLSNINEDYGLFDILVEEGLFGRCLYISYFLAFWERIPTEYIYKDYIGAVSSCENRQGYNSLCRKAIYNKVMENNKRYTVENEDLIKLLDKDGLLTIYHGHCKPTLRNSFSWTLNRDKADFFGNRNALFSKSKTYYIYSGKCRLEDVIAYITDRKEEEIFIPPSKVMYKTKEEFEYIESCIKNNTKSEVLGMNNIKDVFPALQNDNTAESILMTTILKTMAEFYVENPDKLPKDILKELTENCNQ